MNVTLSILEQQNWDQSFRNKTILAGMTVTISFCHCILGCIGLSLNGFITYAITTIEELRSQARYVLFLGMIIGNILSSVNLFIEVIYYSLPSSITEHNFQLIRVLRGLPNIISLANYLLVLIDNYVAITRPDFHRAKFTVRNVVPCQIGFNLVVCSIANILYLVDEEALDCKPSYQARMLINATLASLFFPCVILKLIIFIKTRNKNSNIRSSQSTAGEIRIHATQEAIVKREREAMKALMLSVLSLAILYAPRILFEMYTFVCSKMNPLEKEKCNFVEMQPIFSGILSLYSIIQPLIFLWFCGQFWTAWNNRHRAY